MIPAALEPSSINVGSCRVPLVFENQRSDSTVVLCWKMPIGELAWKKLSAVPIFTTGSIRLATIAHVVLQAEVTKTIVEIRANIVVLVRIFVTRRFSKSRWRELGSEFLTMS